MSQETGERPPAGYRVVLSSRFDEFAARRHATRTAAPIISPSLEIVDPSDSAPSRYPAAGRTLEAIRGSDLVVFLLGRTLGDSASSYVEQEWLAATTSGIPWIAFCVPRSEIEDPAQGRFWERVTRAAVVGQIGLEPGRETIDARRVIHGALEAIDRIPVAEVGSIDA